MLGVPAIEDKEQNLYLVRFPLEARSGPVGITAAAGRGREERAA
jgi:hypothetical protein